MTPPAFFAVAYAINPWMDVTAPVDVQVAQAQWEHLHQTYLRLGHSVDLIEPISGLPDMVYTANGGFIAHDIPWSPGSGSPNELVSLEPMPAGCPRSDIAR